jgi:hypothetical protein
LEGIVLKRWLILVTLGFFVGAGVAPLGGTAAAAPFSDISSHWAKANIEAAVQAKYVSGYPDGSFKPDAKVSRAEFLAIVTRASRLPVAAAIETFEDVASNHWAVDAINKGIGMGFINPADFGKTFSPDKALTRAEMVKWLVSGLAKGDASFVDALRDTRETILPFTEYFPGKFKEADIPYIAVSRGTGLVGGFPDGSFGPDRTTTRAEVVVLLERYLGVEGTKADAYKSLNELREVGLYGTNVKTIGNAVFPKTDQGVELSFYDAFNVELATEKPVGTLILRKYIVIDPQLTSVYKDMFMAKEEQEVFAKRENRFQVFSQVTFSPARDMIENTFRNIGPITGTTFQARYGVPEKYGFVALSSSGGNIELLKTGNTNTFWSQDDVSLEHRFGVTTNEGRYKGLALLGSEAN